MESHMFAIVVPNPIISNEKLGHYVLKFYNYLILKNMLLFVGPNISSSNL